MLQNKLFKHSIYRGCGFNLKDILESCKNPNTQTFSTVQEGIEHCAVWPDENDCIEYKDGLLWQHLQNKSRINNWTNGKRLLYYHTKHGWFQRKEDYIDIYSDTTYEWIGRVYRAQFFKDSTQLFYLWYNDNLDQVPIYLTDKDVQNCMLTPDFFNEWQYYFHRPTALSKYKNYLDTMPLHYKEKDRLIKIWCNKYLIDDNLKYVYTSYNYDEAEKLINFYKKKK